MRVISDLERSSPERGTQNEEAMAAQELHAESSTSLSPRIVGTVDSEVSHNVHRST